ncbi:MAG: CBS domain-containing protein [Actinomycetota bacterium]
MALLVRHAMTEDPQTAQPSSTAEDAARLMEGADVGAIPVMDNQQLVGLVTDRDLVVRVLAKGADPARTQLRDLITPSPVTVSPDTQLADAQQLMSDHQVRRLPVVKNEELVGVLSLGDVAVAMSSKRAVGETLDEISESPSTQPDLDQGPDPGTPEGARSASRG